MSIADRDAPDMPALVQHLEPAEGAILAFYGWISSRLYVGRAEIEDFGAPSLGCIDELFKTNKPSVANLILVAVEKDCANDWVIGLYPAVRRPRNEAPLCGD